MTGFSLKSICLLFGLLAICAGVYSQPEGKAAPRSIPEALLRPERGETPRYPKDVVIGEIGRGEAPEEAYLLAKNILSALITGSKDASVLAGYGSILDEDLREEIRSIEPRSYRIGGGRAEADGCVSFLVRFMGPEESISGELFLRQEPAALASATEEAEPAGREGKWILDDLVIEDKRTLSEIRDSYRFDFSPYERFY